MPWLMELVADSLTSDEDLMFDDRNLALRISTEQDGKETTSGWRHCLVERSSLYYSGTHPIIRLEGNSLAPLLKQKQKWRVFTNRSPGEIVRSIAPEYGMIAQTPDMDKGTWQQLGEHDWSFLRSILEETSPAFGQKRGWLVVDGKTLKILTLNYAAPVVRSFLVGRGDDRSAAIKFVCHGRAVEEDGGSKLRIHGFNILGKHSLLYTPPDAVIPVLTRALLHPYGTGFQEYSTSLQTVREVQAQAKRQWVERTSSYFSFQLSVLGDVRLRAGDMIEVIASDTGVSSSLGGKYPIYEVQHIYAHAATKNHPVGVTTHLGGFRRTFLYGDIKAQGIGHDRVISEDTYARDGHGQEESIVVPVVELP
jgi:hypothetical protein